LSISGHFDVFFYVGNTATGRENYFAMTRNGYADSRHLLLNSNFIEQRLQTWAADSH
jgi:hypothetical protein